MFQHFNNCSRIVMSLLLLTIIVVFSTTGVLHCDAFTPTTITTATTICDGITTASCNVDAATTLDVNAMTTNAGIGNTARFETTRMGFAAQIIIDCTSAAVWTHGANLLVRITHARTTATTVPQFLDLRGPLNLGSSIIVEGGSYNYNTPYCTIVRLFTNAAILGNSVLSITGTTIQHLNGYDASYLVQLIVYSVYTDIVIDDRSTLAINDNTVKIVDGTAPVGRPVSWLTFYSDKVCVVSKSSTVSIANNTYSLTIATQTADTLYIRALSGGGVQASDNSTVIISRYNYDVTNSNFQGTVLWAAVVVSFISLSTSSSMTVNSCQYKMSQVTTGNDLMWNFVNITNNINVSGSSSLDVSGNSLSASQLTSNGYLWNWNFINVQVKVYVLGGSTFTVNNNAFSISGVTLGNRLLYSLLWLNNGIIVDGGSTLTAHYTTFDVTSLQGSLFQFRMIFLPSSTTSSVLISDGSVADVSNFKASLTNLNVATVYWCSLRTDGSAPVTVDTNSMLSLSDVDLSFVSSVVNYFVWQFAQTYGRITSSNSGNITMAHNTLTAHNLVVYYNNWVFVYAVYGFESSHDSIVALCDNAFDFANTVITGPMSLHLLYAPLLPSAIFDVALFNASGNQYQMNNVSVAINWNQGNMGFLDTSYIANYSRVLVIGNYFNYTDAVSGGGASPSLVSISGMTISNHSELQVLFNIYDVNNYTDRTGFGMYMLVASSLTVSDYSIVNVSGAAYTISNTVMPSAVPTNMPLFRASLPVAITSNSQFIISNNNKTISSATYNGVFKWNIVEALSSISVSGPNSQFNIVGNTMSLSDATLTDVNDWQALSATVITLISYGQLRVNYNTLVMTNVSPSSSSATQSTVTLIKTTSDFQQVGGGVVTAYGNSLPQLPTTPTYLNIWNITAASPSNIQTCDNTIGGTLCLMDKKGVAYTCLLGGIGVIRARDCRGTYTQSQSPSESATRKTSSTTKTSILTTTASHTEDSPSYSNTRSPPTPSPSRGSYSKSSSTTDSLPLTLSTSSTASLQATVSATVLPTRSVSGGTVSKSTSSSKTFQITESLSQADTSTFSATAATPSIPPTASQVPTKTSSIPPTNSLSVSASPSRTSSNSISAATMSLRTPTSSLEATPTLELPPTSTSTLTISPSHLTKSAPSHTMTPTPPMPQPTTPLCNTTAISDTVSTLLSALPLFKSLALSVEAVQSGFNTSMSILTIVSIPDELYTALHYATTTTSQQQQQQSSSNGTLLYLVPEKISVAGNAHGFAHMSALPRVQLWLTKVPTTTTTTITATTSLRLVMQGSGTDYTIDEDESLAIYVSLSTMMDSCNTSSSSSSAADTMMILIGRLKVKSTAGMYDSPPAVVGTAIGGTIGVVGGVVGGGAAAALTGDQIGLSAISMFSCADPRTGMAFGSFRLLSPFAIFESYAGVILGNVASIIFVGIVQGIVLLGVRCSRRTRPVMEWMATSRFPSLLISVSLAFHTGTAFAASQLISSTGSSDYKDWEVAVGAVAFAYILLLPVVLILHPYLRIERAYQAYELEGECIQEDGTKCNNINNDDDNDDDDDDDALATKKVDTTATAQDGGPRRWPSWVITYCMPDGAVFSAATRQAYGSYISSYRAPATQVWWTSYPTWTASIIGLAGLVHPTTILGCQALFAVMGVVLVVIAVAVMWRRPFRSTAGAVLDAISKVLLAGVLFCLVGSLSISSSSSSSNSTSSAANAIQMGILALGLLLMVVTLLRAIHACVCMYFDWRLLSLSSSSSSSDPQQQQQSQQVVALSLVWHHIPGESKKTTRTFAVLEDDDRLHDAASIRDGGRNEGEEDIKLGNTHNSDEGGGGIMVEEMLLPSSSIHRQSSDTLSNSSSSSHSSSISAADPQHHPHRATTTTTNSSTPPRVAGTAFSSIPSTTLSLSSSPSLKSTTSSSSSSGSRGGDDAVDSVDDSAHTADVLSSSMDDDDDDDLL